MVENTGYPSRHTTYATLSTRSFAHSPPHPHPTPLNNAPDQQAQQADRGGYSAHVDQWESGVECLMRGWVCGKGLELRRRIQNIHQVQDGWCVWVGWGGVEGWGVCVCVGGGG